MRNKNTLIMAVIAGILAAAVYFLEIRGSEEREEAERVADRLLRFETESVDGLTIEAGETRIALRRADDTWRITAPYDLAADDGAVSGIVSRLQTADHDRLIEETPEDLGRFGLADPEVRVTVGLDDGSSLVLTLGSDTPVGSNAYARTGDDGAVYTTATSLKGAVNKSLFDLRDRSILAFEEPDVARFELTTDDLNASMQRQPALGDGIARWELTEPIEARADTEAISGYLGRLRSDKALAYPTDEPSDEDLVAYGLDDPRLTVRIWTGDDSAMTLEVGDESDEPAGYYARRLGNDAVFVVPPALLDEAPDSVTALRNRTVAEFARDRVEAIEIETDGETIRMEKDGIDWRVVSPRDLEGDSATASSLLTATLDMYAAEFAAGAADAPRFGFATPHARVAFNLEPLPGDETGQDQPAETITLLIGAATEIEPEPVTTTAEDEAEEGEQPEPTAARYVTVEGEPTVYIVGEEDFADILVDLYAVRSKTLVAFAQSDVSRIELTGSGSTYELTKSEEDTWTVSGGATDTDLTEVVDNLLWSLNYLRMEGVAAEPQGGTAVDLAPFGLGEPAMSVRAFVGDEPVADLDLGGDVPAEQLDELPAFAAETQIYGAVEGTPGVFRLDAKLRDALQAILDEIG